MGRNVSDIFWLDYTPRNHFREEEIISTRKKSFPRGRNYFHEAEIMLIIYGYISNDRHLTSYPFNPVNMSLYRDEFSLQENFYLAEVIPSSWKYFFLAEIFLPCGSTFPRRNIFPCRNIPSSRKRFLPGENDFFPTETISGINVPSGLP